MIVTLDQWIDRILATQAKNNIFKIDFKTSRSEGRIRPFCYVYQFYCHRQMPQA